MFIELHILQNFAPSNLNRDESNSPKDCVFGGVRRARISSQCIKRSIRSHPSFEEETDVETAYRTRLLATIISDLLQSEGKPKEESDKAASDLVSALLGGVDAKKPEQSKVLFYTNQEEKEMLTYRLLDDWDKLAEEKSRKEVMTGIVNDFIKIFQNRTSAPDIAMFGRMLAEEPKLNLDAAAQVAHAISTHRANMEFDFFTAVDDLQREGETGAGMMGVVGFNAATFYRYANIDFNQLVRNLDGEEDFARASVRGFLKAAALAIPTGKQNSFAAQNPPSFLMAVVRKNGGTWSMANAFEKPINASGDTSLLTASIEALDTYWGDIQAFYGGEASPFVAMVGTDASLKNLSPYIVPTLEAWLDGVLSEVERG